MRRWGRREHCSHHCSLVTRRASMRARVAILHTQTDRRRVVGVCAVCVRVRGLCEREGRYARHLKKKKKVFGFLHTAMRRRNLYPPRATRASSCARTSTQKMEKQHRSPMGKQAGKKVECKRERQRRNRSFRIFRAGSGITGDVTVDSTNTTTTRTASNKARAGVNGQHTHTSARATDLSAHHRVASAKQTGESAPHPEASFVLVTVFYTLDSQRNTIAFEAHATRSSYKRCARWRWVFRALYWSTPRKE